jgi:UDP-3-O-[3-hydroxymyristoyl] glucosamine N-acyltransferase
LTLRELAERINCQLEGEGHVEVVRAAAIEQAGPGDLTLAGDARYLAHVPATRASAVIVPADADIRTSAALLRSDRPQVAFARALAILTPAPPGLEGIHPTSHIAADASLGEGVGIGAFVCIGERASIGARTVIHPHAVIGPNASVGDDCVIHAHVSVRDGVIIGHRVIIEDGAVIGGEGFGFVKQPDGSHLKIPQRASVVIEDDVEIGANTAIDRPAVGETRIGAGTKIDNLVQIAHGVRVGRHAVFASQVGIAGSSVIEDDVVLAGQVGVADHLRVGKGVVATAQTGIPSSVDPGQLVSGYPAIANRDWRKSSAVFRQLPALKKRVADLERRIVELEEKLDACRLPSDR